MCRVFIYGCEQAYKPGSVLSDHLSRPTVASRLVRPTFREAAGYRLSGTLPCGSFLPHLVLLRVGFTRPTCYHAAGELLPHHFNLTSACAGGRCVSVALSLESPPPDVIWHPCPMEPGLSSNMEFPPYPRSPGLLTKSVYHRVKGIHNRFRLEHLNCFSRCLPEFFSKVFNEDAFRSKMPCINHA